MTARTAAVAALLPLLLLGCSDDATVSSGASPSPSSTSTDVPRQPDSLDPAVPFHATLKPSVAGPIGGPLGVRAARSAAQDGYDRVVIELGGKKDGQPGWRVQYVTTPTSDGSGDQVTVKGAYFLQVLVQGVGLPDDTGVPEPPPTRFSPTGTPIVKEVVLDGVFEGQYTVFIGVAQKQPFRVFRLSDPARVVIDVRHR